MSTTRLFDQDAYLGEFEATVERSVCEGGIFTVNFSEVPGFVPTVARYLADIESLGMAAALKKFLNA